MTSDNNIIVIKGTKWKHNFLNWLCHVKDFPTRLRIFHAVRKFWGLELLQFTTPSGLHLLLNIDDWVQSQVYFFGNYEKKSVALFQKLAQNATVIFDIGAHIGQYALEVAQADTSRASQIFAIEVNPKTFTYLLNNVQLNEFKNVKAVLGAISSQPDILNINMPAYWNMGNTQINESEEDKGANNYLAASFSIVALLKKYNLDHIDLVKIDVEGHELSVLNDLFEQSVYPANIIFEYIPDVFTGLPELITLLEKKGYIITDIDGNSYAGKESVPEQNLWAQKV